MSRTFVRQDSQIRNSDVYDDTVAPSVAAYETNPTNIETDLNNVRSQLQNILNRAGAGFPTGNWYDDIVAPSTYEGGVARGVSELNQELHDLERKRVLVNSSILGTATVGAGENFFVLTATTLPANTTAALGAVTTQGTVVAAHGGTFGTHSLAEVGGSTAISPKNFVEVVDADTRDQILSGGRVVYGLLQVEEGVDDGDTITDTTDTRAQVSFVRINAAGDDLEAVPASDIEGRTVNFSFVQRKALEDLTEQDFLRGAITDVPSAATVTQQVAYDNQGTTPVDLTNNFTLDLEGAGLTWLVRDDAQASVFSIVEGSAGGTTQVNIHGDVDEFDVDAAVNDFMQGVTVDSGGTALNLGVTAGRIDAASTLTLESTGATSDLSLVAGREMLLRDLNQTGSTWTQSGIKLSDTTAEWDAFETAYGEVSLLSAIVQAKNADIRTKGVAVVTGGAHAANTNMRGGVNLDTSLPAYNTVGSFVNDVDVYLNGVLLRNGADASANHDVYPGTDPAQGDLMFEFTVKSTGSSPDVITSIVWAP